VKGTQPAPGAGYPQSRQLYHSERLKEVPEKVIPGDISQRDENGSALGRVEVGVINQK